MKVRLLDPAVAELDEAVAWYRALAPGLAERFLDEVRAARQRICDHPDAWHPLGDDVRRFRLERFPYGIIYVINEAEILIVAIAHLHREPGYWRSRLPK